MSSRNRDSVYFFDLETLGPIINKINFSTHFIFTFLLPIIYPLLLQDLSATVTLSAESLPLALAARVLFPTGSEILISTLDQERGAFSLVRTIE